MSKTNYPLVKVDWSEVKKLTQEIANKILSDNKDIDLIVPIIRGGMPIAMLLSSMLDVEEMSCIHIRRSVDDTLDSKVTLDYAINLLKEYQPKSITVAILYNFNKDTFDSIYSGEEVKEYKWVIFPWEKSEN